MNLEKKEWSTPNVKELVFKRTESANGHYGFENAVYDKTAS